MKTTRIARWTAAAVSGAALAFVPLAAANAATAAPAPFQSGATAHTTIKNAGDSGDQGNVWATVGVPNGFSRDLTLTLVSHPSASVYDWTGSVSDHGTGVTVKGAVQPNGTPTTATELNAVPLTFSGGEQYAFTTNKPLSTGPNHGVPASITRNGTYYSASPITGGVSNLSTDDATTSAWYALAFPSGTTFTPNTNPNYSYSYKTSCGETWTDSNTVSGAAAGNITGKTCTSSHPTPPPTGHPTPPPVHHTHYTFQAVGHVQSEQSHLYLTDVDGNLVQEYYAGSSRFAMVLNHDTGTTGLALVNRHNQMTGYFVSIPDSGQAVFVKHFVQTSKHGSYYSNVGGNDLNNARYSLAPGNHQIGWAPVRSANEAYTSPGQ
jgi:hypothetical protein